MECDGGRAAHPPRKRESVASEGELRLIGREVASAVIKGQHEGIPKPTDRVPVASLLFVCGNHRLGALSAADFGIVAEAMVAALEEAARWSTLPTSAGDR